MHIHDFRFASRAVTRRTRGGAVLARIALATFTTAALLGGAASGSAAQGGVVAPNYLIAEDGSRVPIPRQTGFNLFAEEDLAATGMKMTGGFGWYFPNNGPCPYYALTIPRFWCGLTTNRAGGISTSYFGINLVGGAPISEFRKIRAVHPGVSDMQPPLGYTAPFTEVFIAPMARRWGPADGQFGNLFSGVTSAADGSCRDHTSNLNGQVPTGFTLLAGSDCPETWPSGGFDGKRPVLDSAWIQAFNADPDNFQWNDWKLPQSAFDMTQFLGSFTSYGAISDSYREVIQRFGSVTRLGAGAPLERGYPLGLDIRMDAWQFGRPSIRNAVFYQLTMVNNSERIYGQGIDYDSLYFGMDPGYLQANRQTASWYHDFSRGAIIATSGNTSGRCSATYPRRIPGVIAGGCPNTAAFTDPGQVIMVLKSPLGDLRNKLLSDPTSPFYNPASPYADDTITFNHARRTGFGNQNASFGRNDRALFGYISSTEENFLDERTFADFTAAQLYLFFQNDQFDGTSRPENARFSRFVPGSTIQPASSVNPGMPYGSWDYDNDGIQDTIYVPSCGQNGCIGIYSDTSASGLQNIVSNIMNVFSSGPFKLAAGDTTQFLYVFGGAPDSSSFETLINNVVTAYLANFQGANPIPPPVFSSADVDITPALVRDSTLGVQTASIRIRLVEPAPYQDQFVERLADRIATSDEDRIERLRRLNPHLVDAVNRRVTQNFSQLLVFKSCDKGQTWTVSANCTPAPATDPTGAAIGFGWQPLTVINVDTVSGRLATNAFTDVVQAGRQYTYSFVTRTRGVLDIPVVDSIGCQPGTGDGITPCSIVTGPTDLQRALAIDADTISSPLVASGPSTVTVYAPISLPAGTRLAQLDTIRVSGNSTRGVSATARSAIIPGRYQVAFANRFIVTTERDTVTGQSTQTIVAQRLFARGTTGPTDPEEVNFVASELTFTGTGEAATQTGLTIPSNRTTTTGSVITFVDTVTTTLGYVIAQAGGSSKVYFLSHTLSNPPATFEISAAFPGFLVQLEAIPGADTTRRIVTASGTAAAGITLRAPGDTLHVGVVEANGVVYQAVRSRRLGPGGIYEIEWGGDAFGPASPFTFGTRVEMQPVLDQSLAARAVLAVGDTADTTRTLLVSAGVPGAATRELVPVKVPFELRTPTGEVATLAMFARHTSSTDSAVRNSILVGTAGDTTRLSIPTDLWMPADTLFVIENVQVDSTIDSGSGATTVINPATGQPYQVTRRIVSFTRFVMSCNTQSALSPSRFTCNPIRLATRGATAYLPFQSGWITQLDFARPFDLYTVIELDAKAQVADGAANGATRRVLVVPNPYVVMSPFDDINPQRQGNPRVLFTNVPEQGTLRIYSISGQYLQQLTWTGDDLLNRGTGLTGPGTTMNGDLPYNLRTREGLELASGLYLFVITGTGPNSQGFQQRGKFVIIR